MTSDEAADASTDPSAGEVADASGERAARRPRPSTDHGVDQSVDRGTNSTADGSESASDSEAFRAFWGAVLAVDVGLFCVVVGPVLVYASGRTALGSLMFLVGLGAFYRAYAAYRDYVDDDRDDGTSEDPGDAVADDEEVGA